MRVEGLRLKVEGLGLKVEGAPPRLDADGVVELLLRLRREVPHPPVHAGERAQPLAQQPELVLGGVKGLELRV